MQLRLPAWLATNRSLRIGLAMLAVAVAVPQGAALSEVLAKGPEPIAISATAIPAFTVSGPDRKRFGRLEFRGGLQLRSPHPAFGGFSGLARSPDGRRLTAISDKGYWLSADVAEAGGRMVGLDRAVMGPLPSPTGRPLASTRSYDTEGLAMAGPVAYVSIERTHEVLRFDWGPEGPRGPAKVVPVPREVKALGRNRGLESIGVAPPGSPVAGAVVTIAEEPPRAGGPDGFILTGARKGSFSVARHDGFAITDMAFLPGGDLVLLERRYVPPFSLAMRLRLIDRTALHPGALVDGEILLTADLAAKIDNMEGLAAHRNAAGETILTLISDDNFSMFQRTLLLEFALLPPETASIAPPVKAQ
ncbi:MULTISPECIES: esterase-like activity of phytase family protein [unclassified Chelatococcus]|uniref:esterase-like activity of phytase family protein n=1 Tax=unclassified Chelatococcus TaxID=2638111 RepID=UPI0020BE5C82|nr:MULTISPECIES: esterase-like activity of phytase family protein [unclassified Chelatococcus]MCO5078271.1 esterase-like activity of phytase family protein [Chelatococcus sp.]CAH1656121.1 Phytase-like domain-containing protein [Hyphomicrobiales bacterium]CAH1684850.1 Phytase-like domain-containing protein [Hyphomicrobiales bacterium]